MQEELQTGDVAIATREIQKPRIPVRGFAVDKKKIVLMSLIFDLFLLDQVVKWLVFTHRPDFTFGPLRLSLFLNTGIVFSLPVPQYVYLPLAIVTLAVFELFYIKALRNKLPTATALSLIIFGAFSNIIDRVAHGGTVDYLIFFKMSAVNLADGMILVGIILFIYRQKKNRQFYAI